MSANQKHDIQLLLPRPASACLGNVHVAITPTYLPTYAIDNSTVLSSTRQMLSWTGHYM